MFVPLTDLRKGYVARPDPARAEGLSLMENCIISDRDGVAVRPGTELYGAADTSNGKVNSLFTAKLRSGTNVMLRSSDGVLEYYNTVTSSWATLKSGYTDAKVFGFVEGDYGVLPASNVLINHPSGANSSSTNLDKVVIFCNGIEPYSTWRAESHGKITEALTGGETAIKVDTTLTDTIYYSGTASSVTTTTITIGSSDWATDIWNTGFVVRITNGAQSGQVRDITDTTATQITFGAISGLSGTPTFEIRALKYPASGTIINGSTGTTEAYTAINHESQLTSASVSNAHALNVPIAIVPTEYPVNPRGNILASLFGQVYLAGNAMYPTTMYRSKITDFTDFTFASPRAAGEGDVIPYPECTPAITDITAFEDSLVISGESRIEQTEFSQDASDLPNRTPLLQSSLLGASGRSAQHGNDLLFANKNNEITTLGRIVNNDTNAKRRNIGWPIKYGLRNAVFDSDTRLYSYKNYTLLAYKTDSSSSSNDQIAVFDHDRDVWIGVWNLPASSFAEANGNLYMGSSASREVYKMFDTQTAQDKAAVLTGYKSRFATQWINQTKDTSALQSFNTLKVEGYIKTNTPLTFKIFYDFSRTEDVSWTWDPAVKSTPVLGEVDDEVMGVTQVGVTPLGVELDDSEAGDYGEQRFIVFFKLQERPHNYVKLEVEADGSNKYFEITELATNMRQHDHIKDDYIIDIENAE